MVNQWLGHDCSLNSKHLQALTWPWWSHGIRDSHSLRETHAAVLQSTKSFKRWRNPDSRSRKLKFGVCLHKSMLLGYINWIGLLVIILAFAVFFCPPFGSWHSWHHAGVLSWQIPVSVGETGPCFTLKSLGTGSELSTSKTDGFGIETWWNVWVDAAMTHTHTINQCSAPLWDVWFLSFTGFNRFHVSTISTIKPPPSSYISI